MFTILFLLGCQLNLAATEIFLFSPLSDVVYFCRSTGSLISISFPDHNLIFTYLRHQSFDDASFNPKSNW